MNPQAVRRTLLLWLSLALSAPAPAVLLTREFTGSWYDPAKVGQGFNLDVVDNSSGKTAVLYWYTYDAAGRPLWLYGQAVIPAGNSVSMDLFEVSGPRFAQDFSANQLGLNRFGQIQLSFSSCTAGAAVYSGTLGIGSFNLSRLTQGFGGTCTGTLIDDGKASTVADAVLNVSGLAETIRVLQPTAAAPMASGELKYRTGSGRIRFSVEVEDLPVGNYSLLGNGVLRATLNVVSVPGGTQAEVEFSAPADGNELPLDFDPRNMSFVIRQGTTEFMTGRLDAAIGIAPPTGGSSGSAPPTGNALTVLRFGTGAVEAKAELKQESSKVEFEVELEGVPAGRYDIQVGSVVRGSISVNALSTGRTYGETEFRNPVESGKLLLNFDPRGALISLRGATGIVASATFPTQGNAGGSAGVGSFPTVPQMKIAMSRVGPDSNASGELEFESSSSRQDFKVEVEDLDNGSYDVEVDGVKRATLNVNLGRAEVEFRNPVEPGKQLLDFPVQGKLVRVLRGGVAYLSGSIPAP